MIIDPRHLFSLLFLFLSLFLYFSLLFSLLLSFPLLFSLFPLFFSLFFSLFSLFYSRFLSFLCLSSLGFLLLECTSGVSPVIFYSCLDQESPVEDPMDKEIPTLRALYARLKHTAAPDSQKKSCKESCKYIRIWWAIRYMMYAVHCMLHAVWCMLHVDLMFDMRETWER